MTELDIDQEKLAEGLERGVELIDGLISVERDLRLRMSYCGVASVAIAGYLSSKGHPTYLIESNPQFTFEPELRHVMVAVGDNEKSIIDATYSQFLELVGLTSGYVFYSGQNDYPPEKIAIFKKDGWGELARKMARYAVRFQSVNSHPDVGYGMTLGHGPLEHASEEQLQSAFAAIWDGSNFRTYRPSSAVKTAGNVIQAAIDDHMRHA